MKKNEDFDWELTIDPNSGLGFDNMKTLRRRYFALPVWKIVVITTCAISVVSVGAFFAGWWLARLMGA